MEWQAIATAPRDGTHILVLGAHGAVEAWFKRSPSMTGKYPPTEAFRYREPCGKLLPEVRSPSYWMPLPPMPAK